MPTSALADGLIPQRGLTPSRWAYARAALPDPAAADIPLPAPADLAAAFADPGGSEDEIRARISDWAAEENSRYTELFRHAADACAADVVTRRALLAAAPLMVTQGAWLQWLSAPGNAELPSTLSYLALYADDLGVGRPHADRGSAFLSLMRAYGVSEYAVPAARLVADPRVPDASFELPGRLLAMSRQPDRFRAVIAGADLALRTAGLLPPLSAIEKTSEASVDWAALDPRAARRPGRPGGLAAALTAVAVLKTETPQAGADVLTGMRWAMRMLRWWSDQVAADLAASLDPEFEMAELVRRRAPEAAVYHRGFQLAGRPFRDLLEDAAAGGGSLLDALAASKLVQPGDPDRSRLLTHLVQPGGPMFRVFTPDDETVIRRWIRSLPQPRRPVRQPWAGPELPAAAVAATELSSPPADLREAYHLLTTRTGSARLRGFCEDYVTGWLERARQDWAQARNLPPRHWEAGVLRTWLRERHAESGRGF